MALISGVAQLVKEISQKLLTFLRSKRACNFLKTTTVHWNLFNLLTRSSPPLLWLSISLELATFINTDFFLQTPARICLGVSLSGSILFVLKSCGKQLSLSTAKPPQPCHQLGPYFIPAPFPCCTINRPPPPREQEQSSSLYPELSFSRQPFHGTTENCPGDPRIHTAVGFCYKHFWYRLCDLAKPSK